MDDVLERICEISSQVKNDNTPEDKVKMDKINELSNKLNQYLQEIIGPMNGVNITINSHYDKSRPSKNYFEILNENGDLIKKICARNPFNDEEESFEDEIVVETDIDKKFTEKLVEKKDVPERNILEYKEIINKLKEIKLFKKIQRGKLAKNLLKDAYISFMLSKKGYNIYDDILYTRQYEFCFKDNNGNNCAFRFQYIYIPEDRRYNGVLVTIGEWGGEYTYNLLRSKIEFTEIMKSTGFNKDEVKMLFFLFNILIKIYDNLNIFADLPSEEE
jgi:hypothetical protein